MRLQILGLTDGVVGFDRADQCCDVAFPNHLHRRTGDPLRMFFNLHIGRHDPVHIDRVNLRCHRSPRWLRTRFTFWRCGCLSVSRSLSFSPAASSTPCPLPFAALWVTSPTMSVRPDLGSCWLMSILFTASAKRR